MGGGQQICWTRVSFLDSSRSYIGRYWCTQDATTIDIRRQSFDLLIWVRFGWTLRPIIYAGLYLSVHKAIEKEEEKTMWNWRNLGRSCAPKSIPTGHGNIIYLWWPGLWRWLYNPISIPFRLTTFGRASRDKMERNKPAKKMMKKIKKKKKSKIQFLFLFSLFVSSSAFVSLHVVYKSRVATSIIIISCVYILTCIPCKSQTGEKSSWAFSIE